MPRKQQRPPRRPPARTRRDREYSDKEYPKPRMPWYGNPKIIITIGIIVIISFVAVPIFSVAAGLAVPGAVPAVQRTPGSGDSSIFTEPTFTPVPSPTPAPTVEGSPVPDEAGAETTPDDPAAPGGVVDPVEPAGETATATATVPATRTPRPGTTPASDGE